jgi:N-acetylglucosaminyl-diphospho-decaprenol L-rhamnosyltransferase
VISLVIVTMNTRDLLAGLLTSIEGDLSLRRAISEVILVDNGSSDGTDHMVANQFPWAIHIKNPENRGFAASVNIGCRYAKGEFVFLLNSDTRLIPDEAEKMLRYAESNKDAGIIGPQLVYEDMRLQRSYALSPTLAREIFGSRKVPVIAEPHEVETLIGAAIMFRRKLFDDMGGFDERFFFFLEETDFCIQAARKKYRVVFFPATRLVHLQGKTVSRTWVNGRIEYSISLYKFLKKYHSVLYFRAFAAIRICKALLFIGPMTVLPFLWISRSMRRKYTYYSRLLLWHLQGCPDGAGLKKLAFQDKKHF